MIFHNDVVDLEMLHDIRQMVDPLEVDVNVNGQDIRNGRVVVGCKAGPLVAISHLLHEVCHFIEIDNRRVLKWGWGLKYGKTVPNPYPTAYAPSYFQEFRTDQHIQRETRVWAMQYVLSKSVNVEVDAYNLAGSAKYLPEFSYFVKGTDEEATKVIADRIEALAHTEEYSIDAIRSRLSTKRKCLLGMYKRRRM
jgi:hypothetical protein